MKKKLIFISIIVLATLLAMNFTLCFTFAGTSSSKTSESSKPIYLALGDSITYGYEPGDTEWGTQLTDECFVSILAKDKGYTAVNKGVIGNTAAGVLQQLNNGEFDDTIQKASIITLTCGGNDLMEVLYEKTAKLLNATKSYVKSYGQITAREVITILALSSVYPDRYPADQVKTVQLAAVAAMNGIDTSKEFQSAVSEFITTLNQLTAAIKSKNSNVKIYVATQYNPYEHFTGTYQNIGASLGSCAKILAEKVRDNAATGGYQVADVYKIFLGHSAEYGNATEDPMQLDFHPSVAGHAAIAKCFEEIVPDAPKVTPIPDGGSNSGSKDASGTSHKGSHSTTTGSAGSSSVADTPDTGDDTNLWIPFAMMSISTASLILLTLARGKSRKRYH